MLVPIQKVIVQRPIMSHMFGASSLQEIGSGICSVTGELGVSTCCWQYPAGWSQGSLDLHRFPPKMSPQLEGSTLFSHRFMQRLNRPKWLRSREPKWAWWKPPDIVLTNFAARHVHVRAGASEPLRTDPQNCCQFSACIGKTTHAHSHLEPWMPSWEAHV